MPSTFLGIEIARRALFANQHAMQTAENNIANTNTEGYSRQRAVLSATTPYTMPLLSMGQVGTGVELKKVERLRDDFLDVQLRANLTELGFWQGRQNELARVEAVFTEAGENSLATLFDRFWAGWQELSNNPQDAGVRLSLRQAAVNLTGALNYLSRQVSLSREESARNLRFKAGELNELAGQLAEINGTIARNLVKENHVLMDERDLLLDKMAGLANIEVAAGPNNQVTVKIGEVVLVEGSAAGQVQADENGFYIDGTAVDITGGELAGILTAGQRMKAYQEELDKLAREIVEKVNEKHRQGFTLNNATGVDFFDPEGTTAASIRIGAEVESDADRIAAAKEVNAPGDGRNALEIAGLREENHPALGNTSFSAFYRRLITMIGSDKYAADQNKDLYNTIARQFEARRQSLSGVSVDEELTMLMQYQYAYQASAQALKIIDEVLDTLINIRR